LHRAADDGEYIGWDLFQRNFDDFHMLFKGTENEHWFRSPFERNVTILNERARADLRMEIWEVQRQNWERWSRWVPLLTGLTGLFGAAFGLIVGLEKWL
jgi:hypothetical protein